jgi:hypothetical protein
MPSSSAAPAGWSARHASPAGWSPPEPSFLGWLILIPVGCVLLGQVLFAWSGIAPVLDGVLVDPDAYMRLNRVLELHQGGAWFDSRFPRIDPPAGHVQHWTRPLDLLLLIGAWLLQPALGFEQALHWFGVLFSPLCLALTVVALAWAAQPILDRDARMFACLALLLQPAVLAYSSLGRPDHHALLLLLGLVLLGQVIRLLIVPTDRRTAGAAGLTAALALWVSPEVLTLIAPCLASLGLYWLLGDRRLAGAIERCLMALCIGLALALLAERGPEALSTVENDRLSLLHVAAFGLLALAWAVLWRSTDLVLRWIGGAPGEHSGEAPASGALGGAAIGIVVRAIAGLAAGLTVALALLVLFPELRQGPLGYVDPLYAQVRLRRISEIQPLLSPDWLEGDLGPKVRRALRYLGLGLLAVPFIVTLVVREQGDRRRIWVCIAMALGLFVGLTFYQIRWSSYAQLFLVLPYSALMGSLLRRVAERASARALPFCRAPLMVLGLFWPFLLPQLLPQQRIETAGAACPVQRLSPVLDRLAGGSSRTVMAYADYGPELLYRTGHSVLSIPNHRPQPGFTATYLVLTRASEDLARAMLAEHGVDWILLCPSATERSVFVPDEHGETLYERLAEGAPPPWLRPLPLPEDLAAQARLYAISPAPAIAGEHLSDAERL